MTLRQRTAQALIAGAAALVTASPAMAATDKGDTAFLMLSTVLVLLMTIPGLALFYCGLVRTKNAIAMLMQVFVIVCIVCVIWMLYGYSLSFTNGGAYNDWIGGFSKAFLARHHARIPRPRHSPMASTSRSTPTSGSR